MNKLKILNILLISLVLVGISGCGYTTRSCIYPAGTSIAIKSFVNKINISDETSENRRLINYFPLLETKITNAVVSRFILDGNIKISRLDRADLILEGEALEYKRDSLQYTENNEETKEYRVTLFANVALRDARTDKVLWQENRFAGDATYYSQGTLAKSETSAVEAAISDLARRIVERVVESW